jgi:nitrite reductase/ring-hydroxylating ferredoxin subunit
MDYKIDRLHELNEDDIKVLVFDKKEIIVVKHEGEFYAFLGKCTHLGCNLKNGTYSKGIITCPCHGSSFSVIDGSVVKWIEDWPKSLGKLTRAIGLARSLETYRVYESENEFYLLLE